jgi:nucleoside-diphosphate-sugar epimerase
MQQHTSDSDAPPRRRAHTVAVTGAAGFIGGRLVEQLRAGDGPASVQVRAYCRGRSRAGLEGLRLDDAGAVDRALSGCDVLVHCAFDFHDTASNLRMLRVLGSICATRGIRLVLLSTAAVYEPFPDGRFDESTPSEASGIAYSDLKIRLEQEAIEMARSRALDVVILQPTVVYGPGCRGWTDTPARELLTGRVVLPNNGEGICNAIHVDDVCSAVIAAMTADASSGERFLLNGPKPVTWGRFYLAVQTALGTGTVDAMTPAATAALRALNRSDARTFPHKALLKQMAGRWISQRLRTRLKFGLQRLRSARGEVVHMPDGARLDLYAAHGEAVTDKAHRLLGWTPQVHFDKGMISTAAYLRSAFAAEIAQARGRGRLEPPAPGHGERSARQMS